MNTLILLTLFIVPGQAPPLVCDQPVVDRGQVRGGPQLTQKFTLHNRGPVDVAIVEARASCGCLTPKLSARMLQPGGSATIDLEVTTVSQPDGPNRWSVRLQVQPAGGEPVPMDLLVKAHLVREVSLQPSAIRLIGKPGLASEITLIDRRAKPLPATAVGTSSNRINASAEPWRQEEAGWVCKIRVGIAPGCPVGKFEDIVQIFSADPEYRELRVAVSGECRDKQRYLVTPREVHLDVKPGKPAASFTVLIRDREDQPVEIEKVESDDPALDVRFVEGASATARVRLAVVKDQTPARWSNLKVQIRAPIPYTLIIPVTTP